VLSCWQATLSPSSCVFGRTLTLPECSEWPNHKGCRKMAHLEVEFALIRKYASTGSVTVKPACRNGFKRAYTDADIRLLAAMDERYGAAHGAALKNCVNEPTSALIKQSTNGWLLSPYLTCITCAVPKSISDSAILTRTLPKTAAIGQRHKPCPSNQLGYICIDSFHKGD